VTDPLLDVAKELEELVLKDDYFVERRLFPNVDFIQGLSTVLLVFPPIRSRLCLPSAGCRAGSRIGRERGRRQY